MAYMSNESDRIELYVRPSPDVDKDKKLVSPGDIAFNPLWPPDGRELFYINGKVNRFSC
jgi:hypothetical protein